MLWYKVLLPYVTNFPSVLIFAESSKSRKIAKFYTRENLVA